MKASNEKLAARAIRIVIQATECSEEDAKLVLQQSHYDLKTAILMKLSGLSYSDAQQRLVDSSGFLYKAVDA